MYAIATDRRLGLEPFSAVGTVVDAGPDGLAVETAQDTVCTRRAASCLIEPEAGDRVLVAGEREADLYVIAVLERAADTPVRITLTGDCAIAVKDGRLSLAAADGIDVVSGADMGLSASRLTVRAASGQVLFDKLAFVGRQVFSQVTHIKFVGSVVDAIMDRVMNKVKRSYRIVEDLDCVRSGQIDYKATQNVSVRGKNTLVTAQELVKLDGDQIHLG